MTTRNGSPKCVWVDDEWDRLVGFRQFLSDHFDLRASRNFSRGVEALSTGAELLLLDLIIPYGVNQPSLNPYLGLKLAEKALEMRPPGLEVIVFFTVVHLREVEEEFTDIQARGEVAGINVVHRRKGDAFRLGSLSFCRDLLGFLERGSDDFKS